MNPLIDLSGLSKPATVLIERVSDATGGIFKPWQIERVAKAKAKAKARLIKVNSEIEADQIRKRAFNRFISEELDKQRNIENITTEALPLLEPEARPDEIEHDWIVNFFDKSRLISDTEMQQLWAKILAGEANLPGSFSKRTINLMASLDKNDAQIFERLCNFCWKIEVTQPLIYDHQDDLYTKNGISFSDLNHLDSIGLITFEGLAGYENTQLEKILTSYQGSGVFLEFEHEKDNKINVGQVLFTDVGRRLSIISDPKKIPGFEEYVMERWLAEGVTISSPYNHPPLKQ